MPELSLLPTIHLGMSLKASALALPALTSCFSSCARSLRRTRRNAKSVSFFFRTSCSS